MPIVTLQRRMMELGRVRMGEKGPRGEPRKLNTFRFTSPSKTLLDAAARAYGGEVVAWKNAPDEGYFQLNSDAPEIEVVFPPIFADADGTPTVPVSQWFELWSAGGCQRRCDGETELLSGKPCLCEAANDAARPADPPRACKPTTRMSFMLPDLPGLGVWRLETHGYNAAAELPGTVAVLAQAAHAGEFIRAALRIEHRTKKVNGETLRYIVPVVDLRDRTVAELAGGSLALNAPPGPAPKPALPAGTPEPEPERFENDDAPPATNPPPLPDETPEPEGLSVEEYRRRCNEAFLSPQKIAGVGRRMFPGRSASSLTDAERGQLWAELEREKAVA